MSSRLDSIPETPWAIAKESSVSLLSITNPVVFSCGHSVDKEDLKSVDRCPVCLPGGAQTPKPNVLAIHLLEAGNAIEARLRTIEEENRKLSGIVRPLAERLEACNTALSTVTFDVLFPNGGKLHWSLNAAIMVAAARNVLQQKAQIPLRLFYGREELQDEQPIGFYLPRQRSAIVTAYPTLPPLPEPESHRLYSFTLQASAQGTVSLGCNARVLELKEEISKQYLMPIHWIAVEQVPSLSLPGMPLAPFDKYPPDAAPLQTLNGILKVVFFEPPSTSA